MTEVYLNNKFIGTVTNPQEFVQKVVEERRKNKISKEINIFYNERSGEILMDSSKGRARRPLIVVKDGKSLLTEAHVKQLEKNELSWKDLVEQSVIEYLDAMEEENTYVAIYPGW